MKVFRPARNQMVWALEALMQHPEGLTKEQWRKLWAADPRVRSDQKEEPHFDYIIGMLKRAGDRVESNFFLEDESEAAADAA